MNEEIRSILQEIVDQEWALRDWNGEWEVNSCRVCDASFSRLWNSPDKNKPFEHGETCIVTRAKKILEKEAV